MFHPLTFPPYPVGNRYSGKEIIKFISPVKCDKKPTSTTYFNTQRDLVTRL